MGRRRLAVHPGHATLTGPVHQEALGAGEDVLTASGGHRRGLARVAHRVVARGEAHPLVAEQFAVGGLGHAGDIRSGREPRRHLLLVVDPAHVIAVPVGDPDRFAEDQAFVWLEESKPDIHRASLTRGERFWRPGCPKTFTQYPEARLPA